MHELIIIGGGIAGQTAAIYAAIKKMDILLITKEFGGQFYESSRILNYPGILEITGSELSTKMKEQLRVHNVAFVEDEEAVKMERMKSGGFTLSTVKGVYNAQTVIIATGASPKKLGIKGEQEFFGKGVSYCAICDGTLFSGMDVAIVGAGSSALEAADFMRNIARKIYLVNNMSEFNAHEYLVDNVRSYKNVEIITDADTKEIRGNSEVKSLIYWKDGRMNTLQVGGVFIEIGRMPNTEFLKGFLKLDEDNHVEVDCGMRTSVEGVYAAGDCTDSHEYQYVIAAGQGCMALLKAARYIANKKT